ncbi:MAG TPA: SusC/RagA family TonB-linked outer membrane protein [Longimicrobiales bacterium]|nr:SusC/RagA family TonB-linked outer membrane protein [Longimicrobiales bacterium]
MKLMLRRAFATAALLLVPTWLSAQETRVTGQVTAEETGQPLAGVQIVVKGTTVGTLTDGAGNYAVRIPAGSDLLVFSYLGYRTVERQITGPVMNVSLNREAIGLEGITVTALGIQREKRSLGYSIQQVQGEQLTDVPKLNIVDALHGHVAGVHITTASNPGGSSRIVIRGASSISGNNQPLFVVDGVPIDNRATSNAGNMYSNGGGYDYGNRAADIDPNNIESISVLKGPNAAALYGSRAANGAIVITTKKGHVGGGLGITASSTVTFEEPLRLPSYQNKYGQGSGGRFDWVDGNYGGINDGTDESWGPEMRCSQDQLIRQFFSDPAGPGDPFCPSPDNVSGFFETGLTVSTNVALARSDERSNVRLSVTSTQMDGMYPTNELDRMSAALAGGVQLTDRLSAEGSVNYMNNEGFNRPGTGYTGYNIFQQFVWFGRQVDTNMLRNYQCGPDDPRLPCALGQNVYNWNYSYHENPYFIANENSNQDATDRIIGHAAVSYDFTDWLSATARSGTDWYEESRKRTYGYNGIETPRGSFGDDRIFNRETNTEVLATATRSLTPDFDLTVNAGANRRDEEYILHNISVNELVVPGIFTVDNAAVTPNINDFTSKRRVNSLYGAANLNFRNYLSVDVTGRNDWSSTLPEENNSYFYPSISGALVFTDAFGLENDVLSSGKVRASWTRVGNDAAPYQTTAVFASGTPWGGIPGFTVPNTLPNNTLKPEETTAWEVGTDLGFLNERAGFVLTYYNNSTVNQIMGVQVSAASGYTNQVLNAGEVENKGLELQLLATPVRMNNGLRWDMTLNWAKNDSKVVKLYGDLQTLVLGSYWGLNIEARAGEPYGVMFGTPYRRDPEGRIVVHPTLGYPLSDAANRRVLGNYNPDWTAGLLNRFSFGAFDASVLFDMQQGGNVFSVTNMFGRYAGVLEETLEGRENGPCDPGIIVPNSVYDSDPGPGINYVENTSVTVCPELYNHALYGRHEAHIFDASYVKLREMKLGWRVPASIMDRVGFSSASLAVVGRNLALWTDTPNIDPETAFSTGNVQGLEYGQFPTARSIGFTVTVRP